MAVEAVHVKMGNLRAQAGLHLRIHLIARLHELHSQIHVISWQTIMRSQSQRAWKETHQMILGKKYRQGSIRSKIQQSPSHVSARPGIQSNSTELIKNTERQN